MSILIEQHNTLAIKQYIKLITDHDNLSRVTANVLTLQQAGNLDHYNKKNRVTSNNSIITGKIQLLDSLLYKYLVDNKVTHYSLATVEIFVLEKLEIADNLYSNTNIKLYKFTLTKKNCSLQ